ncbi:MAG: hemerythrin [Acidimicrobiaceae bacterium]|nr:hemerythrin [Acidimicrobiaceae bacterium]
MPDAITLLRADHRSVEKLFKAFEKSSPGAHVERRRIVDEIIVELSRHAAIEEQVLYPSARREVAASEDEVLEALEEHHVAKWLCSELEGMDPEAERFAAKTTVLIESVRHHVKEEEGELFPLLRQKITRKRLNEIGAALEEAKKLAPSAPHPRMPDTPPANLIGGVVAGVVDKVKSKSRGTSKPAKARG